MTIAAAAATFAGGFLFPFMVRMIWGKMVESWGPIGGWMAAAFIVGTVWTINHGISSPMIFQSGVSWVDMGLAAGIGVYVASAAMGGSLRKSVTNVSGAILGGIAAGFLLSLFL